MLRFEEKKFFDFTISDIYVDDVYAGSMETYIDEDGCLMLENIRKDINYKGKHLLRQVITELKGKRHIKCLPLKKYRSYYEELGFKPINDDEEDRYYMI